MEVDKLEKAVTDVKWFVKMCKGWTIPDKRVDGLVYHAEKLIEAVREREQERIAQLRGLMELKELKRNGSKGTSQGSVQETPS